MPIERMERRVSVREIRTTASRLLDASLLCAIATTTPRGGAYVNTAYFAWTSRFDLVWLSDPAARHSRNLEARPATAIAVYDSTQAWGSPDRGIQLFGSAREIRSKARQDAEQTYARRFPSYSPVELSGYRLYRFRPIRLKLFDERALGPDVFVTAKISGPNRIAWEKTELYRGS